MKKLLPISLMLFLCISPMTQAAVHLNKDQKSQVLGLGTGAAVGAIVAGPPGAFVGGLMGTIMGSYQAQHDELADTQLSLQEREQRLAQLEDMQVKSSQQAKTVAAAPVVSKQVDSDTGNIAFKHDIIMDVMFKTASSQMIPRDTHRITELGAFLEEFPLLKVRLDGYSDWRGQSAYNLALSEKRLDAIKQALLEAGVDQKRIETYSHGSKASNKQDVDGTAFDRYVSITLLSDAHAMNLAQAR